jgi:hypothetical protein
MYIRMPVGLGVVVTVMTVTVPVTFAAVGERHDPTAEVADPGWSWDDWTQLQIQTCRNSAKSCSC